LGDLRKNNKTKTKGTKIQRAIRIVESSLDDSLVVEEAIKTEEDGNNFDTGKDTDINTTGTNSISNDNSYSITKPEKIFTVKSKTDKSKYYTVNIENNTCTCADFSYRKNICKHIIAAKLLSIY
jgi:hypothetical protein